MASSSRRRRRTAAIGWSIAWGGDGTVNEIASALVEHGDRARYRARRIGQRAGARTRCPACAADAAIAFALSGRIRADRRRSTWRTMVLQHRRHRLRCARGVGVRPRHGTPRPVTPTCGSRRANSGATSLRTVPRERRSGGRRRCSSRSRTPAQFGNGARIAPSAPDRRWPARHGGRSRSDRARRRSGACRSCSPAAWSACRACRFGR